MTEVEHPHLAVMFTDIEGYSRMMSEDEAAALKVLSEHNEIMESVIDAHGGRVIKKLGDSYMVVFDQGDTAVRCGLHALAKIAARNRQSDKAVEIRVGIHEGSMRERAGDFFGENVNIAARLEQLAQAMTIAASEKVVQAIATRVKCEARFIGAQSLKNLRYPVSVYRLTPAEFWKLYLSTEGPAADEGYEDVLGEITDADAAWQGVEELTHQGSLDAAAKLADASLSKFGGAYADYVTLATIHLLAGAAGEAQSALKMGEMLGHKDPQDDQFAWIQTLAGTSIAALKSDEQRRNECLRGAQHYAESASGGSSLSFVLLCERLKTSLTGHMGGLTALARQHSDKALVLREYAEALKGEGRESDAYSMLERAIAVAPDVAEHRLQRVQWMVDSGDLEAVLAESEKLAKQFPDDPRIYQWTGETRLLNLDPHGAQWVFEQRKDSAVARSIDSARWHICSLMQQGRFEVGADQARQEMRNAIRQNRQRRARNYLQLATTGMYLEHWSGVMEILEEYKRYDPNWFYPQAALIAAKFQNELMPWDRAVAQLNDLAAHAPAPAQRVGQAAPAVQPAARTLPYSHPSGLTALTLLGVVPDAERLDQLQNLEFLKMHRDSLIDRRNIEAAALELRAALRFDRVDTWHLQLVPLLTHLSSRRDHRLPSLLALAGLIQAKLENPERAKPHLEQARKMWQGADWPVWEIQQADATLAAAASSASTES